MSEVQRLEIMDVLSSLPPDKIMEVKDFADFLRGRYSEVEMIDDSDEWSDEDCRDATAASLRYADTFDEVEP